MDADLTNSLNIGTVIQDKWVILEFIARGGMGEVYRAHQLNLKRDVVIKVISQEWLESCADNEEELETGLQRFRNEVQSMARVRHPNIVQIYDHGSVQVKKTDETLDLEYIVMEYIPGNTLRATMSEEGFYPEEELTVNWILNYFMPVLDGVQALHHLEIVHRDLKPENILMDGNTPKIADFGLARSCLLKSVTLSMDVKGTPPYMSPEHFFDFKTADQQADIYSLGKILYEAITGKISSKIKPFKQEKLPDPGSPFFQKLNAIIQNATAEKKEDRLQSIEQIRHALLKAIDILKKESETSIIGHGKTQSLFRNPKLIWAGILIAILSMVTMAIWHFMGEPGILHKTSKTSSTDKKVVIRPAPEKSLSVELQKPENLKPVIVTEDGAILRLIKGGEFVFPENSGAESGKSQKISSFYMDETQVTNHQYVEFLNRNMSNIRVKDGVVRSNGNIWLLLGEVVKGYDPITFQNNRFRINNAAYASSSVLRVTAFGASAYAKFHGRRLPTVEEWTYVLLKGSRLDNKSLKDSLKTPDGAGARTMMDQMMGRWMEQENSQTGVSYKPNYFGIRGMNEKIGEWAIRTGETTVAENKNNSKYAVLGGIKSHSLNKMLIPAPVFRQPWEAFEEVGFRCAKSI